MKKIILMALFCAAIMSVSAQRVYKANVTGDVAAGFAAVQSPSGVSFIIECKGMPEASYTTTAKPTTTDATNNTAVNSTETNQTDLASKLNNKKVAYKFEVANVDEVVGATNWQRAYTAAVTKDDGWRLPTQRELMLIWLMQKTLVDQLSFAPLATANYWSATEYFSSSAWYVSFSIGYSGSNSKAYTNARVRLVRDIN